MKISPIPHTRTDRPFIENARKVVLRGAGKHVGNIHQRKSASVVATPRGLHLGSVESCVRVAAEAFGRDRVRRVNNALENVSFGWNDSRHPTNYRPCTGQTVASLWVAAQVGVEGGVKFARQLQF